MHLTPQQLTLLKNAILADPTANAFPNTPDGNTDLGKYLDAPAVPAFVVWKTAVDVVTIMADGFVWTDVDGLSVAKARIWEWMSRLGTINPSKPNIRTGLVTVFPTTGATYASTLPLLKRNASRYEKVFATGTGSDASPATMVLESPTDYEHVAQARST